MDFQIRITEAALADFEQIRVVGQFEIQAVSGWTWIVRCNHATLEVLALCVQVDSFSMPVIQGPVLCGCFLPQPSCATRRRRISRKRQDVVTRESSLTKIHPQKFIIRFSHRSPAYSALAC